MRTALRLCRRAVLLLVWHDGAWGDDVRGLRVRLTAGDVARDSSVRGEGGTCALGLTSRGFMVHFRRVLKILNISGGIFMELAKCIDHTLLKTDARRADLERLVEEAKAYHFASVCVSPIWVSFAAHALQGSGVKTCTVIGFPQGATPSEVKAFETKRAIADGAEEVDMVIAVGKLKDGDDAYVKADIEAVVAAAKGKAVTKVIIETCLLTDEEKRRACLLAKEAGADFVKTSTGFSTGGATAADVKLMRESVGEDIGVKASGGVRSRADAEAMIAAGATRLGTSSGVKIVEG